MTDQLDLSEIEILAPTHLVGAFTCGRAEQDDFLKQRAREEQRRGLSQVYVSTNRVLEVMAFFTLSPITVKVVPELLAAVGMTQARYPGIGGYLLGQLGVHTTIEGSGIGSALVMKAARMARAEAQVVGGAFLAVDPQDEPLVSWYEKLGFVRLGTNRRKMVLPFHAIP